jgi:hypothetical protein
LALDELGCPRRVLSSVEPTWLICYSGTRFDSELADRAAGDPLIRLVGQEELHA